MYPVSKCIQLNGYPLLMANISKMKYTNCVSAWQFELQVQECIGNKKQLLMC